ncbi:hypothetical protein BDR07DRAFT_1401317, partial [Suillus spraguei]
MANALLAVFYMSSVFALIGFVFAYVDKHPGITKVSPRYPVTKAASSRFAAFQYPWTWSWRMCTLSLLERRNTPRGRTARRGGPRS